MTESIRTKSGSATRAPGAGMARARICRSRRRPSPGASVLSTNLLSSFLPHCVYEPMRDIPGEIENSTGVVHMIVHRLCTGGPRLSTMCPQVGPQGWMVFWNTDLYRGGAGLRACDSIVVPAPRGRDRKSVV